MANKVRRNARAKNRRKSFQMQGESAYTKGLRNIELLYGNLIFDFKNASLYKQVMFCYFILLITFVAIIVFFKFINFNSVLEQQTKINYYSSVVVELLDVEKDMKMNLDLINYNDYMCLFYTYLYFFKIYTRELLTHDFSAMEYTGQSNPELDIAYERTSIGTSVNYLFTDLSNYNTNNQDFSLRLTLNSAIQDPSETNNGQIDPNYMTPLIYTFSPLIYQGLSYNGVNVFNFYFLGYSYDGTDCDNLSESVYFKYPIEYPETSPILKNSNIFDSTLDPIGKCYIDTVKNINKTIVMNTNWYYNYEKSYIANTTLLSDTRLITLLKLGLNYKRLEYFVNYITFKMTAASGKQFVYTFAQKIDREKSTQFVQNSQVTQTDEKPYVFFSMVNGKKKNTYVDVNVSDQVFLKDYNIDDDSTLVASVPGFVINLHKYTMLPKVLITEPSINGNTILLTNKEMEKISDDYLINYYFNTDKSIFQVILFFNNYLKFHKKEQEFIKTNNLDLPAVYNATNANQTLVDALGTEDFHRCLIRNMTSWYANIHSESSTNSYDCLNDFCFFNNCTTDNQYYSKRYEERYLPNCYCFPMYCHDDLTYRDSYSIPLEFLNLEAESNFFSASSDYFRDGVIKCRLSMYQKDQDTSPYNYKVALMLQDVTFQHDTNIFLMYMKEENTVNIEVVDNLDSGVAVVKYIVYCIYSLIMFFIFIAFLKCMGLKLETLKIRINKVKLIIKMILKISENSDTEADLLSSADENNDVIEEKDEDDKILNQDEVQEDDLNDLKDRDNSHGDSGDLVKEENEENKGKEDDDEDDDEGLGDEQRLNINNYPYGNNILDKVEEELKELGIHGTLNKPGIQHEERYSDELQQLIFIIVDNLLEFKIEFNVNTNLYSSDERLNKRYVELVKAKFYQDRIIPRKEVILNSENSGNNNEISESDDNLYTISSLEDISSNLSSSIIYEILSTEEMVDLSQSRSNFYFKEPGEDSIYNFYDCIDSLLYDESNYTNELTDPDKLKTAINYYTYEIHLKWRAVYLKKLENDEI